MCCCQTCLLLLATRHLCENVEWQGNEKGVKKQLGRTWIEVNNEVRMFVVEDEDHP